MSVRNGDLAGRRVVVTGANTGIGRATAEHLAGRGASVLLACRSESKTKPVLDAIAAAGGTAEFASLDLADFNSIRALADRLVNQGRPVDVLINNAGLAGARGQTRDGFELAFGTNHLGHFLFTLKVMPLLRAVPDARIVNVSSKAHYDAKALDLDAVQQSTRTRTGLAEYAVSKLANVLFTRELARRLGSAGPHTYALHPGVVASDAWRQVPQPFRWLMTRAMLTNEQGARTSLYCALSPDVADHTGRYYDDSREKTPSALAQDDALATALWARSVAWTGTDLA